MRTRMRRFWWTNTLAVADSLPSPVENVEALQAHHACISEPKVSHDTFFTQQSLSVFDEVICAILLLVMPPGCFLWMAPVGICVVYATWTMSFYWMGWISIALVPPLALVYVCFVVYPGYFVPKLLAYFSMHLVWEDGHAPPPHSILFAPPHGIFPYGSMLAILFYRLTIRNPLMGAAANIVFYLPISRQLFTWIGVVPATSQAITSALSSGRPMGISPGGIAEIFLTGTEHETVIMRKRKGLVRIALKTGIPLVPCYVFGNTALYTMSTDFGGILQGISRTLRCGLFFFWGRFGLPIARRIPILVAFGKTIPVPKVAHPTEAQVDAIHAQLILGVKEVYYTHRVSYGWEHRELVIE